MMIRPIEEKDVGECPALYNYYVLNTTCSFEEAEVTFEDFSSRVKMISAKYPYIVAEVGGKVLGFAYVHEFMVRSAYRFSVELSLYVEKDARGQNIGSALLEDILKRCKEQGLKQVVSIITAENEMSCRFHEKKGFKFVGEVEKVGYKFGKWLNIKYYQISL